MKATCIALLCLVTAAFGAGNAARMTLPSVPELGTTLRALPDLLSWQLVDRTTVLPCFDVTVGQVDYTVAVEGKKRRVVWVSTKSPNFVSPDNVSVRTKVGDLLARFPDGKVAEEGFGTFVNLPSGWSAVVQREGAIDSNARVQEFFRRQLTPEKK